MSNQDNRLPIVVFPDPIIDIEMLSGAMFLYFDKPITLTIPPVVITEDAFYLLNLIDERKPEWRDAFLSIFNTWQIQLKLFKNVHDMLAPLKNQNLLTVWAVYPADTIALAKSNDLIRASGLSFEAMNRLINPINASGELIRHILLEAFLECNENIEDLYNYCEYLFKAEPTDNFLAKSYTLRLQSLINHPEHTSVLITNFPIWNQLLNGRVTDSIEPVNIESIDRDVIAWEIFKNIISPKLDPLDKNKVEFIVKLLKSRKEQIEKFWLKCFYLADKLNNVDRLDDLPKHVMNLIRSDVEKEIKELLQLDRKGLGDYFSLVFSDEKAWAGIASFIAGVISGNSVITTGAAIAALSLMGSKAVQVSSKRRETISQSDYGLAYTISKKYK